ncbi:unnamed protein product [Boreogadus saida]
MENSVTAAPLLLRRGVTYTKLAVTLAGPGSLLHLGFTGIQEVAPTPVFQPQYSIAEECVSYCQPAQLEVKAMERSGPWWQFSIAVQTVFRTGSTPRVRRGPRALWVPGRDLGCGCPALHVGRTFLLIGSEEGGRDWAPGESRLDKRGRCPPKAPNHHATHHQRLHRRPVEPQRGYIPPHLVTGGDGGGTHGPHARSEEPAPESVESAENVGGTGASANVRDDTPTSPTPESPELWTFAVSAPANPSPADLAPKNPVLLTNPVPTTWFPTSWVPTLLCSSRPPAV